MLPLIKIVTDNLVEVMGQKVDSGESFEVFEYVFHSYHYTQIVVALVLDVDQTGEWGGGLFSKYTVYLEYKPSCRPRPVVCLAVACSVITQC